MIPADILAQECPQTTYRKGVTPMPADYMTTESRLPFSLEAEQSVLGAALLDAGCVPDLVRLVRPEFFYREQHRKIFEVISGKFTLGEPIDIVTVMEAAVREEIFSTPEETKAYLAQLAQMVPSVRNLEAYTNILQSKYHLRALITTSRDIIEQAEAPTAQPEGLLEYAEQRIYDIRNGHNNDSLIPVSRVVLETFDHLQRLSGENRADYLGISTGYGDLDRTITGLNKSDLILVAARPGMGKTAFALHLARRAALAGSAVAVYSLEMQGERLGDRWLMAACNINPYRWRNGIPNPQEVAEARTTASGLAQLPIYVDDSSSVSMDHIRSSARLLKSRKQCDMIIIDYLQLCDMSTKQVNRNREQEVAQATRKAKLLAKELHIPVVLLSQLNRESENRPGGRPELAHLRESGAIEQDADIVILLYRPAMLHIPTDRESGYPTEGLGVAIVAKQRNGETGNVYFGHNQSITKFYDYVPPMEYLNKYAK